MEAHTGQVLRDERTRKLARRATKEHRIVPVVVIPGPFNLIHRVTEVPFVSTTGEKTMEEYNAPCLRLRLTLIAIREVLLGLDTIDDGELVLLRHQFR